MPRSDYELTHHDERKMAVRLARSAIEKACKDSVLRQQLEDLDGVPVATLSQEIYKAGLLKLIEIAQTADYVKFDEDGEVVARTPNEPVRLKALEILMQTRVAEAKLLIEAQASLDAKQGQRVGMLRAQVVTPAELARIEELTRADARQPAET